MRNVGVSCLCFFFFFGIRIYIPRAYNKGTEADTYYYVVRL
jgi:hypothetical protein